MKVINNLPAVFVLALILFCLTGCESKDYVECINGVTWTYQIVNGKVHLQNHGCTNVVPADVRGQISIPAKIGGIDVVSIGENAFLRCRYSRIDIPEGVLSIKQNAFKGTRLSAIVLPKTLTECSEYSFRECELLKAVYFRGDCPVQFPGYFSTGLNYTYPFPIIIHAVDGKDGSQHKGLSVDMRFEAISQLMSEITDKIAAIDESSNGIRLYFDEYDKGEKVLNLLSNTDLTDAQRESKLHNYDNSFVVIEGMVFNVDNFDGRASITLQGKTGYPEHRNYTVMVTSKVDNPSTFQTLSRGDKVTVRGKMVFNTWHCITDVEKTKSWLEMRELSEKMGADKVSDLKNSLIALGELEALCDENPHGKNKAGE